MKEKRKSDVRVTPESAFEPMIIFRSPSTWRQVELFYDGLFFESRLAEIRAEECVTSPGCWGGPHGARDLSGLR